MVSWYAPVLKKPIYKGFVITSYSIHYTKLYDILIISAFLCIVSCKDDKNKQPIDSEKSHEFASDIKKDSLIFPEEKHFKSIKQITFGA